MIIIDKVYKSIKLKLIFLIAAISLAFSLICTISVSDFFYDCIIRNYNKQSSIIFDDVINRIGSRDFNYGDDGDFEHYSLNLSKQKLDEIRKISNIGALYIIKKFNNKMAYMAGSFDSYRDYYAAGNDIDDEIKDAAQTAFGGETYFSKKIIKIDNKDCILCFQPVFDDDKNIIAVIGIEFKADVFSELKQKLEHLIFPLIVLCIILMFLSFALLKRSIKEIVEEISYTDNLTEFKNRMAYEKVVNEINDKIRKNTNKDPKIGIVIYDLNDLKVVNDSLGHLAGDKYIINSAQIISKCFSKFGKTYRIGGDEFVTIIEDNSAEKISQVLTEFEEAQEKYNKDNNFSPFIVNIAFGYDYFILGTDLNLASVIKRADDKMYKSKRDKKRQLNRSPR